MFTVNAAQVAVAALVRCIGPLDGRGTMGQRAAHTVN